MLSTNKSLSGIEMDSVCIFDSRRKTIPFLTVILPTFKRVELLTQALNSLLAQSNQDFEVVVVDNDFENTCDLDRMVIALGRNLPLSLYRNPSNLGMFGNWDRGILLSRTQWVTILHDDDLLAPSFVSDTIRVIAHVPDLELLFFRVETFFGSGSPAGAGFNVGMVGKYQGVKKALLRDAIYKLSLLDYLFKNEHSGTLSAVFSREKAVGINGFGHFFQKYGYISDYAFFAEYCKRFDSTYLFNHSAAYYRFHVNESLKYEIILNFIDSCTILRREILLVYGLNGRLGKALNSIFTALQIKASRGLQCPEFVNNLIPDVIRRYGLSEFRYYLFQFIARLIYNCWQLKYVFSKRITSNELTDTH